MLPKNANVECGAVQRGAACRSRICGCKNRLWCSRERTFQGLGCLRYPPSNPTPESQKQLRRNSHVPSSRLRSVTMPVTLPVRTLVERFDRRGIEPFELFRSEFGQRCVRIQEILLEFIRNPKNLGMLQCSMFNIFYNNYYIWLEDLFEKSDMTKFRENFIKIWAKFYDKCWKIELT